MTASGVECGCILVVLVDLTMQASTTRSLKLSLRPDELPSLIHFFYLEHRGLREGLLLLLMVQWLVFLVSDESKEGVQRKKTKEGKSSVQS